MFDLSSPFAKPPEAIAAVDLGSNSFHMKIARVVDGELHVIDRLREMVRLGAGLREDKRLTREAQARALDCLERFGQRLRSMPPDSVRTAGTNTLRQARNAEAFLMAGEQALGHPIEIISGLEEARLVYLGAAHGIAASNERRLVVDIGGGSTEVIVGEGFTPHQRESLHMGCVSVSRAYFGDGLLDPKQMEKAVMAARLEMRPVQAEFRTASWQSAVGCSGSIRAVRDVVCAAGWSEGGITLSSLLKLQKAMLKAGKLKKLDLEGLKEERKPVFTDLGHCYRPEAVFNPGIGKYLLLTATSGAPRWAGTDEKYLGIFESSKPWGPWHTVKQIPDWGGDENRFQPRIPPKWISEDGKTFHLLYSCFPEGPYQFNVQKCLLELSDE